MSEISSLSMINSIATLSEEPEEPLPSISDTTDGIESFSSLNMHRNTKNQIEWSLGDNSREIQRDHKWYWYYE